MATQKQAESTGDKKPWYPIPRAKFLDYIYSVSTSTIWIESHNPRFEIYTLRLFCHPQPCSNDVATIMQQELTEAGDEAQRRYEEETDPDSHIASGLTSAISAGTDAKRQKLTIAFTKYLSIANLANGKHFLSEVPTKI